MHTATEIMQRMKFSFLGKIEIWFFDKTLGAKRSVLLHRTDEQTHTRMGCVFCSVWVRWKELSSVRHYLYALVLFFGSRTEDTVCVKLTILKFVLALCTSTEQAAGGMRKWSERMQCSERQEKNLVPRSVLATLCGCNKELHSAASVLRRVGK